MSALQHILFLDVETVSQHRELTGLDDHGRQLWEQKIAFMSRRDAHPWDEKEYAQGYKERAAIYAEFGKVIVISTGLVTNDEVDGICLRLKSFYGHDEALILEEFAAFLAENFNDPNTNVLCGHNIREFDIPYLCRRMTVHGIKLPSLLNLSGKKPWEVKSVADTLELWKFGDFKNYTSLDLLAHTLSIPSPKDVMDGSMVGHAYWEENRLDDIKLYCEKDVVTVAQVFMRLNNFPLLDQDQIIYTSQAREEQIALTN